MFSVNLENIGTVKRGQIKINKLTILCGENNTGKTYASYAIYGLFDKPFQSKIKYLKDRSLSTSESFNIDLSEVLNSFESVLKKITKEYSENLYKVFSTNKKFFENSSVNIILDKDQFVNSIRTIFLSTKYIFPYSSQITISKEEGSFLLNISYVAGNNNESDPITIDVIKDIVEQHIDKLLFSTIYTKPFLLPAERSGLNLFNKELNANRNELIHGLGINVLEKSISKQVAKDFSNFLNPYSEPVSDYISFLNRMSALSNEESEFSDIADSLKEKILKGTYSIEDGNISYVPFNTNSKNENTNTKISLHVSSSTVKTLFGLVFYLNYMAEKGQTLIIDEPELNLHPDNQRKMARILAQIANRGINVLISTHSDYIIKEFNNLIMLSNEFENRESIMEKYNYTHGEILNLNDVSSYVFSEGKIELMEIDKNEGIISETFNNVINLYNQSNDDIYLALMEEQHKHDD